MVCRYGKSKSSVYRNINNNKPHGIFYNLQIRLLTFWWARFKTQYDIRSYPFRSRNNSIPPDTCSQYSSKSKTICFRAKSHPIKNGNVAFSIRRIRRNHIFHSHDLSASFYSLRYPRVVYYFCYHWIVFRGSVSVDWPIGGNNVQSTSSNSGELKKSIGFTGIRRVPVDIRLWIIIRRHYYKPPARFRFTRRHSVHSRKVLADRFYRGILFFWSRSNFNHF